MTRLAFPFARLRHLSAPVLVITALWAALPGPARAVLYAVDFSIREDLLLGVGTGEFMFDTDEFESVTGTGVGFHSGVIPAAKVKKGRVDFFGGELAGTHWTIDDISVMWWQTPVWPYPPGYLGLSAVNWTWQSFADGHYLIGRNGDGLLDAGNGHSYSFWWWGDVVTDTETACVPEPSLPTMFGIGLAALGVLARGGWLMRRKRAASIRMSPIWTPVPPVLASDL